MEARETLETNLAEEKNKRERLEQKIREMEGEKQAKAAAELTAA